MTCGIIRTITLTVRRQQRLLGLRLALLALLFPRKSVYLRLPETCIYFPGQSLTDVALLLIFGCRLLLRGHVEVVVDGDNLVDWSTPVPPKEHALEPDEARR